jgi:hypothetical protein
MLIVAVLLVVALVSSVIFNVYYYVNVRVNNENLISTFRARAFWTYGMQAGVVADCLKQYLQTSDNGTFEQAEYAIYRAKVVSDILSPWLNGDSGSMYRELKSAAGSVWSYLSLTGSPETLNETKLGVIAESMDGIFHIAMSESFDWTENRDPLDVLSSSDIDAIISYCQQMG